MSESTSVVVPIHVMQLRRVRRRRLLLNGPLQKDACERRTGTAAVFFTDEYDACLDYTLRLEWIECASSGVECGACACVLVGL